METVPSVLSLPGRCVSTEPRSRKAAPSSRCGQLGLFFQLQINIDDALWNMDAIHWDQSTEFC